VAIFRSGVFFYFPFLVAYFPFYFGIYHCRNSFSKKISDLSIKRFPIFLKLFSDLSTKRFPFFLKLLSDLLTKRSPFFLKSFSDLLTKRSSISLKSFSDLFQECFQINIPDEFTAAFIASIEI
jgi:hypothetical protein